MREMTLKLKMYAGNVNVVNNNLEKTLLRIIFWSFGILALFYVIFLGNMVKNIVERRSFDAKIHVLSSEVGNLELTYLSMMNNVDLSLSYSLGFKEAKPVFTNRKSLGFLPTDQSVSNVKIAQNDL